MPAGVVLLSEFDDTFAAMLVSVLESRRYRVIQARTRRQSWDALMLSAPALVLLPIDGDGLRRNGFLRVLRSAGDPTGVIVIGGPGDAGREMEALRADADQFLTRPLDPSELEARAQAVIRRSLVAPRIVRFAGRLMLDPGGHSMIVYGHRLALRPREFSLIWTLATHPATPVHSGRIALAVLGADSTAARSEVHVLVAGIRRRLRSLGDVLAIDLEASHGYRLLWRR